MFKSRVVRWILAVTQVKDILLGEVEGLKVNVVERVEDLVSGFWTYGWKVRKRL
jgi:hypothetical protein